MQCIRITLIAHIYYIIWGPSTNHLSMSWELTRLVSIEKKTYISNLWKKSLFVISDICWGTRLSVIRSTTETTLLDEGFAAGWWSTSCQSLSSPPSSTSPSFWRWRSSIRQTSLRTMWPPFTISVTNLLISGWILIIFGIMTHDNLVEKGGF